MPGWANAGIPVQRAGGDDDLAAAAGRVGQGRAAMATETDGEAPRLGQIEAPQFAFASGPSEGPRLDHCIGGISTARRLAAAGAMAVDEDLEGRADLIARFTADTATA